MELLLGPSAPLAQRSLWWMTPAWVVGRARRNVARAADADASLLARLNPLVVGVAIPALVVLVALVPSVIHALSTRPLSTDFIDYGRIRVDDVYTESLVFMALAVIIGVASPGLGVFFVLVFSLLDLVAAAMQRNELAPLANGVAGRLIADWLLWLLAVEIPAWARTLAESSGGWTDRLKSTVVGVGATTAFVALWVAATPTLIRPVYTFVRIPSPQAAAILPLQEGGWLVVAAAAAASLLTFALRGPDGLLGWAPKSPSPSARLGPTPALGLRVIRHVGVAALTTLGLAAIITSQADALLLFGVLVLARPVASLLMTRTGLAGLTGRMPVLVRVAAGVGGAYVAALLIASRLYSTRDQTFFAVIASVCAGVFVMELVYADRAADASDGPSLGPAPSLPEVPPVVVGLLTLLLVLGLWILLPAIALADNCADPSDCYGVAAGGAAAAGAGAAAMMRGQKQRKDSDDNFINKKLDYIRKQMDKHPDNPYWQRQYNYWNGPGRDGPGSDGKSTSGQATTSSAAASKG